MSKAADAFRTISEVADELDVPKHVLRFWEARFPQIKPMKRGGGRRYYRPADLDLLRGVRHLLHDEGYTIKGVQKILREQGVEEVKTCWQPGKQLVATGARTTTAAQIASAQSAGAQSAGAHGSGTKANRRGKSAKAAAAPVDVKSTLAKIVAELKACRSILQGEEEPAPARARTRSRG